MKKLFGLLLILMPFAQIHAQVFNVVTPSCVNSEQLGKDTGNMYMLLDQINTATLKPLMAVFSRNKYNSDTLTKYISEIQVNIDNIKRSYTNDKSCFHQYLNKELAEYRHSLELLKETTIKLGDRKDYSRSRFISAYHFMSTSRTLLMAAMDNLNRYTDVKRATLKLDSTANDLNKLLKEIPKKIAESEKNIINETKKQNQFWGITGGIIGGLIAGIVVLVFGN